MLEARICDYEIGDRYVMLVANTNSNAAAIIMIKTIPSNAVSTLPS